MNLNGSTGNLINGSSIVPGSVTIIQGHNQMIQGIGTAKNINGPVNITNQMNKQ